MTDPYPTIPSVDLALGRIVLRRATYAAQGMSTSVEILTARMDQLLDRRAELMRAGGLW